MDNLDILESYSPDIDFFHNGRAVLTMECDDVPDLPGPPVNAPFVEVPGDLGRMVMRVADIMEGITDYPWDRTSGEFCTRASNPWKDDGDINSPTSLGICASLGHEIRLIKDLDARFPVAAEALEHGNVFLHIDRGTNTATRKRPSKRYGCWNIRTSS
jgi:2,3-bisphosphoglycerate-independent phosphoglycerate mutase